MCAEVKEPVCKDIGSIGWLSMFTFWWVSPLLAAGRKRQVSMEDIPNLAPRDDVMRSTHRLLDRLSEVERAGLSHPLLRAMVLTFWPEMLSQKLISVVEIFMGLVDPLILQQVLEWQEDMNAKDMSSERAARGMFAVFQLILLGLFRIFWGSQVGLYNQRVGVRWESALRGVVLSRCVQGHPKHEDARAEAAKAKGSAAEAQPSVYNVISYDIGPNLDIIGIVIGMWSFPLGFSVTLMVLFSEVHGAVVPGLMVGLAIKCVFFFLQGKDGFLRRRLMHARDERLAACTEAFNGIRTLQLLAWTEPFYERIMGSRRKELHAQHMRLWISHLTGAVDYSMGPITNFTVLAYFVLHSGQELKASTWLPVIALINNLVSPFGQFPTWLNKYLIWRDAYGRVNNLMGYEPRPPVFSRSWVAPVFVLLTLFSGFMTALARILNWTPVKPQAKGHETGLAKVFGPRNVSIIWAGIWSFTWCLVGCALILILSRRGRRLQRRAAAQHEQRTEEEAPDCDTVAEFDRCTLSWTATSGPCVEAVPLALPGFTLQGLNLALRGGDLVVLVGREGQGKSSVLCALLGEMQPVSGRVHSPAITRRALGMTEAATSAALLPETAAAVREVLASEAFDCTLAKDLASCHAVPYAPQAPTIFTGTIRWNILFGARYVPEIYHRVLSACALDMDLANMPAADLTEVAQGGATLSGGQRARVGLARAAYRAALSTRAASLSPPCLVLLDDPFASLDRRVAREVCDGLFSSPGGLLCNCAVVLTTADPWPLGYLRQCAGLGFRVVSVDAGHLGPAPAELPDAAASGHTPDPLAAALATRPPPAKKEQAVPPQTGEEAAAVVEEEHRVSGHVRCLTYGFYIRSVGPITLFFLVFSLINIMLWQMLTTLWIVYWTDVKQAQKNELWGLVKAFTDTPPTDPKQLLQVYAVLMVLFTLSNFAGHSMEVIGGVRASRKVFRESLRGALSKPARWWDANPTGRLLNRFSEDVDVMDHAITFIIGVIFGAVLYFAYHVVLLALANPISLAILPGVAMSMCYYANYYRRTIREVQRLLLVSMGIVYQDMVEAMEGRATVCAFANARQVLCQSMHGLDKYQRVGFAKGLIGAWLGLRMRLIGFAMSTYTTLYPVFQYYGVFAPQSAALVGFSIAYSQECVGIISQLINNFSDLEMQLISIERLREYTEGNRDQDAQHMALKDVALGTSRLASEQVPRLCLSNVTITYRSGLPPALSGVTLQFAPQEAVAIIGRTGAGKTSLLLAVLQFVPYSGTIEVDGTSLALLAPEDVRRRVVGVVPQQPLLFAGDVRWNLDPAGQGNHSDEDLLQVLEAVGLRAAVDGSPHGLASRLASGKDGDCSKVDLALSQGQQQLLCAARILLRKQRVVMLDEVTSTLPQETAVATVTDMVARFCAADATVILVTHQDEITACCQRVVTIAAGRVVSDCPAILASELWEGELGRMVTVSC